MVCRTELAESHLIRIARAFSLGSVACRYINGGARNTSYLLSGSGKSYVATVLESHNHASAEKYGAFLHKVARRGIPTPPPVKTRAGNWAYLIENKPVIITPFVEGANAGPLSDAELFELGALLATVHLSRLSCDFPPTLRIGPSDLSWLTQAKDDPFPKWALQQHARTADVTEQGGPRLPTHGDPFRDNIIISPDGTLVLIDWEDAALDRPVFDLAQATLAHSGGIDTVVDRAECLLAGYKSHRGAHAISIDEALRAAVYSGLVVTYGRYRRHLAGLAAADPYIEMWNLTDSLSRRFG